MSELDRTTNVSLLSVVRYPMEIYFLALRYQMQSISTPKNTRGEKVDQGSNTKVINGLSYSLKYRLFDLLLTFSIQCFTEFHLSQNKIQYHRKTCKVSSHYKAILLYQRKEYQQVINVCNSILAEEVPGNTFVPNCIPETRSQYFIPIPVSLAFQLLFSKDITSTLGLMLLIDARRHDTDELPRQSGVDVTEEIRKVNDTFENPTRWSD